MKRHPWLAIVSLAILAGAMPVALGQKSVRSFSVGYVYPAGARQGTTTEHVIAGQNIRDALGIELTGGGVTAKIVEVIRPLSNRERNELQAQVSELIARRAVSKNDDEALNKLLSSNSSQYLRGIPAEGNRLQALKKKYAGAKWTTEDEEAMASIRRRLSNGVRRPANPAISELVVCRLTVARDARPIQRELRLRSSQGVSNPLVFYVGQWDEYSDEPSKRVAEQKSAVAKTTKGPRGGTIKGETKIELPGVINGQILPGEVDRWRFEAKKGARLVASVKARQLIPFISDAVPGWFQATLSLYDATGRELAYRDDFRFDPDPVLYYEIPADGEYVLEIKDSIYRGREDFVYRITVGETPFVGTIFPLGAPAGTVADVEVRGWNLPTTRVKYDGQKKSPGTHLLWAAKGGQFSNFVPFDLDTLPERAAAAPGATQALTLPVIVNGRIARPNDEALFSFQGKAGQPIVAEVLARRLYSPLDSTLSLIGPGGKEVAFNDDNPDRANGLTTHQADSYLKVTLPEDGTYRLRLSDAQHRGATDYVYRLRVSAPRPDFELRAVPSSLNVRAGSTVPLTVHAMRRDGYDGEIEVQIKNAPEGFTLRGGVIPANEESAKLTLTAPRSGADKPVSIELEGRAVVGEKELVRRVVPADDRMQAFLYRHLVPSEELCVAVLGGGGPSKKQASLKVVSKKAVRIPAGGTAYVKFASSSKYLAMKAQLALAKAPEGITIKKITRSDDGLLMILESDASKVNPGLKGNLLVRASASTSKTSKSKSKKGGSSQNSVSRLLPAIPFEVTKKQK